MPGITCLFAHFNAQGNVCTHIHRHIRELSSLGFRIVFISNSPVGKEDRLRLEMNKGIYRIAERENKGNDFGAWQWAVANDQIPDDTDWLLLTNDSIFGPLFPMDALVQQMCGDTSLDFWGLTDSYQGGWHLQTYFVCLSKKTFFSDAFRKILAQDFSRMGKNDIIEKGEIGLSTALITAGFKGAAHFPYKKMDPDGIAGDFKNPTHFFWDHLIQKLHFPYIKKELILFNPEQLENVGEVFSFLEKTTDYPVKDIKDCILDHLRSRTAGAGTLSVTENISVLCHLYYPATIYAFLSKLAVLKSSRTQFIINLSAALAHNTHFTDILTAHFNDAIILYTPDQGRDIGGKLAALDILLKCNIQTSCSLVIHDKNSPHTPNGQAWGNSLMRIIAPEWLPKVFRKFDEDPETGVVTSSDFIKDEFDPDNNNFRSTSSGNLMRYIKEYDLALSDYNFAEGTIFWIRTAILKRFFSKYSPLSIRSGLESGNALDFANGTNIHAWERLFSFIAHSQGYKITGIH